MGSITTTPASMNDDTLQFGVVQARVVPGADPLLQRVSINAEFEIDLGFDGKTKRDSDVDQNRMLHDHPALSPQERTDLGVLLKKIHDYGAANSKWATAGS